MVSRPSSSTATCYSNNRIISSGSAQAWASNMPRNKRCNSRCNSQPGQVASRPSSSTATCYSNNRTSSLGWAQAWASSMAPNKQCSNSPSGKHSSSQLPPRAPLTSHSSSSPNLTVEAWAILGRSSQRSKIIHSNSRTLANTIMDW